MIYDHSVLAKEILALKRDHPFVDVCSIGSSIQGRALYALKLGTGNQQVFYNGTHHGMEWITAKLLMRFVAQYAAAYREAGSIRGYSVPDLFRRTSIWIVPMVNPDGVEISKTVPGWQANANGVDLNHNYNAGWQEGRNYIASLGITKPGPTRWSGSRPESEPESQAVASFTRRCPFRHVLALHSQGGEIYWKYKDIVPPGAEALARRFAQTSGYRLDETEGAASYSGYKDWFISAFRRPGFTIEVGRGRNPLPLSQFDEIYRDILEILLPIGI